MIDLAPPVAHSARPRRLEQLDLTRRKLHAGEQHRPRGPVRAPPLSPTAAPKPVTPRRHRPRQVQDDHALHELYRGKMRKIRCDRVQPSPPRQNREEGDDCRWPILPSRPFRLPNRVVLSRDSRASSENGVCIEIAQDSFTRPSTDGCRVFRGGG
jgi:hypothetical protein